MRRRTREKRLLTTAIALLLAAAGIYLMPGARFGAALVAAVAGGLLLWIPLCRWAEQSLMGERCKAICLATVCAGSVLFLVLEGAVLSHGIGRSDTPADAVVVLGAGVNGTVPSLALQTRIDAAADYLHAHPDIPAVLSGGRGPGEAITEAEAIYRGLVQQGVSPERLLLEEASTSTAENFAYSKEVLTAAGVDTDTAVIAVVSNDFHLYRAERIAQSLGLNATGVPAPLPWPFLSVNYYIREAFALANTLLFQI